MVEEGTFCNACGRDDLIDGHTTVTVVQNQLHRDVEDFLPGCSAVPRHTGLLVQNDAKNNILFGMFIPDKIAVPGTITI